MSAWIDLLKRTGNNWMEHDAPRIGAALAFYTLLSFAPLIMLSMAAGSLLFEGTLAEAHLIERVREFAGRDAALLAQRMIASTRVPSSGMAATVAGLVTLLLGASGVFVELRAALNTMWEIPAKTGGGLLRIMKERLVSMSMVLATGILLIASIVLSVVLAAMGGYLAEWLPVPVAALNVLNFVISLVTMTALFGLILRYVPDARMPWTAIWKGSVVTALLFTIGKLLITMYLGRTAIGSPYGAGGSVVALVAWVYYSAQIFLFGAELTQELELGDLPKGKGSRPTDPAKGAGLLVSSDQS